MYVFRGIPDGLLHERSFFLPCVPPTYYFVSASTLRSMVLVPFASLSPSFHFRIPYINCLSPAKCCMSLSSTNVPSPASPPYPSLPLLLPISLAGWIRTTQSIYYEQINVTYVVGDRLSPWQHMRKHFKMCFRLIRGTFAALIYIWRFQGYHTCLLSFGMCYLTLHFFSPFDSGLMGKEFWRDY